MKDCPSCSRPVDGLVCPSCGYRDPSYKPAADRNWLQCEHVDRGQRCADVGSLSESTRGGGPWFCHKHFPPFASRGYGKPRTAPPGGFKALRDALGQPSDPEAAAEREAIRAESITRAERETEWL